MQQAILRHAAPGRDVLPRATIIPNDMQHLPGRELLQSLHN